MLEIILGVIVLISILLIMIIIINNKFQFSIIKIDKAEEDISLYLDKKKELLNIHITLVREKNIKKCLRLILVVIF